MADALRFLAAIACAVWMGGLVFRSSSDPAVDVDGRHVVRVAIDFAFSVAVGLMIARGLR